MSYSDERTLFSVVDYLENPDVEVVSEFYRTIDNLTLFRTWLSNIEDPNGTAYSVLRSGSSLSRRARTTRS